MKMKYAGGREKGHNGTNKGRKMVLRNIFSKEERGEDGDVIQTVLILSIFVVILMVVGSVLYQAISMKSKSATLAMSSSAKDYEQQNLDWVSNFGKGLEKWSVANPDKPVPDTADYVPYNEYKENIVKDSTLPTSENTFIKVVPNDKSNQSFTVCAYYSENEDIKLRDMNIYSFDASTAMTKKEDRGVCLL